MHDRSSILVSGQHAIHVLLDTCPELLLEIWVQKPVSTLQRHNNTFHNRNKSRITTCNALLDRARDLGIAVHFVHPNTLRQYDVAHRGIIAISRPPPVTSMSAWLAKNPSGVVLVLENISDTHNFGACLRSAEAAGVHTVIFSSKGSAQLGQGVAKTSSGALFHVNLVRAHDLVHAVQTMHELHWHIAGLDANGEQNLFDMPFCQRQAVVVGNEQYGLSRGLIKHCDMLVRVPTYGTSSSLNVSVAAGTAVLWIGDTFAKSKKSPVSHVQ